ncbi:MAG: hypothetical protein LBT71_00065 [Azoarcus sp.]|jgi:pentatricopeptide repeat protein|nr:hypothetical protein [Azoarcus sp.]
MGIAIETAVEWIENTAERFWKLGIAARVRTLLPDAPPEPALFDFSHDEEEGPGLFRELHFATSVTRHVMPESLWREFEAFYRAPQTVSWWMITGRAGTGKSRAAYEFCQALTTGKVELFEAGEFRVLETEPVVGENYSSWRAGFLDLADTPFDVWEAWRPRRHTLLVLDKLVWNDSARGDEKGEEDKSPPRWHDVAEIIKLLARKAVKGDFGSYRVRLLLLERDYREAGEDRRPFAWYRDLPAYLSLRHAEEPTPLPPVSPDGLFSIAWDMQESVRQDNLQALYVVPQDFLARLRVLDDGQRPLFAMLLAAYVTEDNSEEVTRRQVLDYALWREYERVLLPSEIENVPQAMRALVVSTLTNGSVGACRLDDVHALWYSGMGAEIEGDVNMFHPYPVEPDMLGEYFILDGVGQDDILGSASIADADMQSLILKAWEVCPGDVAEFFGRCGQDFADDLQWIETRFLNDQLMNANPVTKACYMRAAAALMTRFDRKKTGAVRMVFDGMNRFVEGAEEGELFCDERARATVTLVRAYCESGRVDEASSIFMGMRTLGESAEVRMRTAEAAACLIEGLSREGELVRARVLFEGSLAFENGEDFRLHRARALVGLINGYGKAGVLDEARRLLGNLAACGNSEALLAQRARASVNVILLHARAGHLPEACEVFEGLKALGDSPMVSEAREKAFRFLDFFTGNRHASEKQQTPAAAA